MIFTNPPKSVTMHHGVRDDAHEMSRIGAGTADGRIYRNAEDPNDIVIAANVFDPAKGARMAASDNLKTAMQKAGVLGAPTIHLIG